MNLKREVTKVTSGYSTQVNILWEHNVDSSQFWVMDDLPSFGISTLYEGEDEIPVENSLLRKDPLAIKVTVEYNGNTYTGTPYLVSIETLYGIVYNTYQIGPTWEDYDPTECGLPEDTIIPEYQQSWPIYAIFGTESMEDGSMIPGDLKSILSYCEIGFVDDDNENDGTESLKVTISGLEIKKLDKEFLPDSFKEQVEDHENKLATLFDSSTYISGLEYIDFVFLNPENMSNTVVVHYNDVRAKSNMEI